MQTSVDMHKAFYIIVKDRLKAHIQIPLTGYIGLT